MKFEQIQNPGLAEENVDEKIKDIDEAVDSNLDTDENLEEQTMVMRPCTLVVKTAFYNESARTKTDANRDRDVGASSTPKGEHELT